MSTIEAPSDDAPVAATLTVGRRAALGTLLEMGPRTVGILFKAGAMPGCTLADRVTITLEGAAVGGTHEASAYILGIHDESEGRRITLRYTRSDDFDVLLATGVGRRFNRRVSFRVEPGSAQPVHIAIQMEDGAALEGQAMDLSATGMALVLHGEMDLSSGQALELRFSLPWDAREFLFSGRVCYCGMREGQMRYGIDFVPSRTRDFEESQDRLMDYVMKRQREILRNPESADKDSSDR